MKRLAFALSLPLALTACGDKLPSRPDETKFRAMSEDEKCRATASRAIVCTNELIVAQVRSMPGVDGELASAMEGDLAADKRPPKSERKQDIQIHKTSCLAESSYADAVFECWSQSDCKQFATCVVEKSKPKPKP